MKKRLAAAAFALLMTIASSMLLSGCAGNTGKTGRAGARKMDLSGTAVRDLRPGGDYHGEDFSLKNLTYTYLVGANMSGCKMYRTYLSDANLSMVNLTDANLRDAKLYRTILTGAYLTNADLSGTDMYRAKLTGADLTGTNFSNAIWIDGHICPSPAIGPLANWKNW